MSNKKVLSDLCKFYKNKTNNQNSMTLSSKELKKLNMDVDDFKQIDITKEIEKFRKG